MTVAPLPLDFYKPAAWYEALLNHYGKKLLPAACLQRPLDSLTRSVAGVIDIYGNFPGDTFDLLKHAISPLIEPDYYREKIYQVIKQGAIDEGKPLLNTMAECLLYIRRLAEQDKEFLMQTFQQEIKAVGGASDAENLEKFSAGLQRIAKGHVTQICNMIKQHGV